MVSSGFLGAAIDNKGQVAVGVFPKSWDSGYLKWRKWVSKVEEVEEVEEVGIIRPTFEQLHNASQTLPLHVPARQSGGSGDKWLWKSSKVEVKWTM